jgi:uncharacterized membrane protein YccC
MKNLLVVVVVALGTVVLSARNVKADEKRDRAAIAEALGKLATSATSLARDAKSLDDRSARKKFAPAAQDLADDLVALARRANKDVALKTIAKDAQEIDKSAAGLLDLADDIEDKDERKALRARAALIGQGVASVRKQIDGAANQDSKPAASQRFTGIIYNNSNDCSWAENVRFLLSANGKQVWTSGLVFPGKSTSVALDKGSYFVRVVDTAGSKLLAQGTLEASKEGWAFKSGCVNQD